MKTIEFRAFYNGQFHAGVYGVTDQPDEELISVTARNINSGFTKALKIAQQPLGNGWHREIARIEFWRVV